ncbi:lysylphosphatidylglycerol synthase domain-containing protein [Vitiosangium sp. GDMCC 1.1324]|uniref:lysylphosphatidylglycerol synthase domain-containing protein n=1 Tax=Vitiosangium sp. (strain GDMCC 1.1324) TaxID=2138576 RepID=UPI000D37AE37|nr:lysylphosphatidylglycerol synthase domain-containing protein [Vitiosangium sp. GDMCC 1.1324]PTL85559.1 hypothetical protein DAT35_02255 [Vitiosangium sp. GDMCC 1.1324]
MRAAASTPSTPARNGPAHPRATVLYGLGLLTAGGCLFWTFRSVDLSRAWNAVALLGPALFLTFLPFSLSVGFDGLAWSRILSTLGRGVAPLRLAAIRLITEALCISLPGGILLAESLKPVLLEKRHGVPLDEGVSVIAARKWSIILAHGLYLGLATLLGWQFLATSSQRVLGVSGLPRLAMGAAVALFAIAAVSRWLIRGGLAGRLGGLLRRIPLRPLRRWVEARELAFRQADGHLGRALAPRNLGPPALFHLAMWLTESAESFLLLRLLGFDVAWSDALAIEAVMSVLKVLVFFVPAGLGVQDAGYAAFIAGMSGSQALHLAAAFTLVKRSRELFYLGLGYALLLLRTRRARHLQSAAAA